MADSLNVGFCVLPPPAPLADGETETVAVAEPPPEAALGNDPEVVETPIDWDDDKVVIPVVVAEVPGEAGEAIPEPAAEDEDQPCDAIIKYKAGGKACSAQESAMLLELSRAVHGIGDVEQQVSERQFRAGAICDRLETGFGWKLKNVAKAVNYSNTTLSTLRSVFRLFPTPESRLGRHFAHCQRARQVFQRLPESEQQFVAPSDILQTICDKKMTTRQATAHFQQQALDRARKEADRKYIAVLTSNPEVAGQSFNEDCLAVLRRMEPKSIMLINADPPYASFLKLDHAGYSSGKAATSGLRTDCANNVAETAVPLSCEIFRASRHAIRDDGCLVYWSAGNTCDRPEVILAAREAGWECRFAGFWKKRLTQPGNYSWPWSTCLERFLVFYPKGALPLDHSQALSRTDVITPDDLDVMGTFKSPSQMASADFRTGRKKPGDVHMFEKPVELCSYFIEKLTLPGDLVVDAFGCSGNMCVAAAKANRRWAYIELDSTNYRWGVGRIADAVKGADEVQQVADDLPF